MSISRGPNELLLAAAPIEYHWPQLLLNDFSLSSNEIQLSAAQKNHDHLPRLLQNTVGHTIYKLLTDSLKLYSPT